MIPNISLPSSLVDHAQDSNSDNSNDELEDTPPQENVTTDNSENLILQMLEASHAMRNTPQGGKFLSSI